MLLPALGIGQIVSWGTLYYAIAVLGGGMRRDLNIGQPLLFGAFTGALVVSGLLAPAAGRWIDRRGGRSALCAGSAMAGTAMLMLGLATGPVLLFAGWALAGAAMAYTLYDPAFAALHRLRPDTYRRAVTTLTLFGGFASTVFWPLASALQDGIGWRGAFLVFAFLHFAICLPIHWLALPREDAHVEPPRAHAEGAPAAHAANIVFYWLAAAFASASFIIAALSVHLIELLKSGGLSAADAVWIGACVGPMQVTGRVLEFAFSGRTRAIHVGYAAFALLVGAMALLAAVGGSVAVGIAFALFYGMSNGILTIVRGVAPAELMGSSQMGSLLGRLGRMSLIARASAPVSFALLLSSGLRGTALVWLLAGVALLAGFCFVMAATCKRGKAQHEASNAPR